MELPLQPATLGWTAMEVKRSIRVADLTFVLAKAIYTHSNSH